MNPLRELLERGQSYWLDNLTRGMIRDGELERRVREEGLRGVTSNPAIFSKAISRGGGYDEQIEKLAREGRGLEEIFERIAVDDIRDACDVLRPVWEESGGRDGFVSLEVSPHLAHDTRGSVEEALHLFGAVDRPNVLIKIPGTPAGVPAIEELLYEGVNVNVTLLFSVDAYDEVARAYLRALERRREEGASVDDVASVASFFLSRIDVLLDRILGHRIRPGREADGPAPEQLLGRAAVANAKIAYRRFRELFSGDRWEALAEDGARPQRMLWASTSTKNPLYRDVRYVEPLIGEHTVNTLPERTIEACADHGRVADTVEEDLEHARSTMAALAEVGVDFDQVTAQLLHEGVEKFVAPYDRLMATLGDRRRKLLGPDLTRVDEAAGELRDHRDDALEALDERRFVRRLHARDPGLWTGDDADEAGSIRRRLGWLDAGERFRDRLPELAELAASVRDESVRDVVLLGTGGSVGAARALHGVLGSAADHPELTVLDDPHPAAVRRVEEAVDLEHTLFVVASKSGTTTETTSLYRHFWRRVREALSGDPGDRFVAVTDPGTPLAEEAEERGFRALLLNPDDVGGRYSALSLFGLVPSVLTGAGPGDLLDRAAVTARECDPALPAAEHPGVRLGALLGMAGRRGRDKLTLFTSDALAPFRPWLEQLVGESLGKDGRGLVPVAGETPVVPGAYGDDRIFVHLRLAEEEDRGLVAALDELEEAGHPVVRIELPSDLHLAGEFYRWELAVATAGAVLGVNPFDEPDVDAAKRETRRLLEGRDGTEIPTDPGEPVDEGIRLHGDTSWLPADGAGLLHRVADAVPEDGYLALLPFFPLDPALAEALEALRRSLWTRSGAAVTVNRGPAYLHATGQLHKGGPANGVFVVLTGGGTGAGPEVPGEDWGLGELHRAQALGDQRVLERRGRRVIRLELDDPADGLRRLHEALRSPEEAAPRPGATTPSP